MFVLFSTAFSVTDGSLVLKDLSGIKRVLQGSKHVADVSQLFNQGNSPTVRHVDKLLQSMFDKLTRSLQLVDKWAGVYMQHCFSYAVTLVTYLAISKIK